MTDWIKKLLAVFFLTLLIWAWAFLSLEKDQMMMGYLMVAPVVANDYLITFDKDKDQIDNLRMNFKGAPAKLAELIQRYRVEKLEFFYDPKEFGHNNDATYRLDLADFIRRNSKVREYALTLESCVPDQVEVKVEKLVKKTLTIQCVDETGTPIKFKAIEPAQVDIPVRQDYTGPAIVLLTAAQQERAKKQAIDEKPYVEVVPGKRRFADQSVRVTLAATEQLKQQPINPMVGYIVSPTILGQYKIELINESDFKSVIDIRGTEKAFDAFKKQRFQILIEIRDSDTATLEIPPRPVIYNFPLEFVKTGQIEAPATPLQARIRLTPITGPAATAPTVISPGL